MEPKMEASIYYICISVFWSMSERNFKTKLWLYKTYEEPD